MLVILRLYKSLLICYFGMCYANIPKRVLVIRKFIIIKKEIELKELIIEKRQFLQRSGEFNSKIYYVKSGLLRSYTIDKKGKEHIFLFAPEGWVIADNVPPEEPTMLFIDALEDSIVVMTEKNIDKENNGGKLIKRLAVLQKRIIQLMSSSSLERYEDFISTYPELSQRIPQRMIASYLGVTPEALSKVKSESFTKRI